MTHGVPFTSDLKAESEARLRLLVQQLPVGVFFFNVDCSITEMNPCFMEMMGSPHSEFHVGFDLRTAKDPAIVRAIEKALQGETAHYTGRYRANNLIERHISAKLSPIHDKHGTVTGGMGIVKDVSQQVQTETSLRESQQWLSLYVKRTPLGVIRWNVHFEVTEWNEAATRIFGYTEAEAIGRHAVDLILPLVEWPTVQEIWLRLLSQTGGERNTNSNTTQDGRVIICDWYNMPLVDSTGAVIGVSSLVEDITEHKAAEDRLKRSESNFRTLIERMPDAIGVFREGSWIYANPAFVRYLGHDSTDDLIGKAVREIFHPDDLPTAYNRNLILPSKGVLPPQEYRLLHRNGHVLMAELVSMLIGFDGAPATLTLVRDLTERKLMQAHLLQSDRMASVGMLAAGVAHEINNPLSYLMANLDSIKVHKLPQLSNAFHDLTQGGDFTQSGNHNNLQIVTEPLTDIASMIEIARDGAQRVRNIVRDLKTFSRGDEDRRSPIDVRRVLDASINVAWSGIHHRARLVREYDDVPFVYANESRLGQVFLNLLLNAAQAMPQNPTGDNEIRAHVWADHSNRVLIQISDTGQGIAPDVLERIFDPFFTTKPPGVGTGLGLWICQGIVTSLQGQIAATSIPGQGTTFTVTLPPFSNEGSRDSSSIPDVTPRPKSQTKRYRILLIDDELDLARAVSGALADTYNVVIASSAEAALDLLHQDQNFDVILCDLMMPQVTGMDLWDHLRREHPALTVKMIFITGGAYTSQARDFVDTVPNIFLEKPFSLETLRAIIEKNLQLHTSSLPTLCNSSSYHIEEITILGVINILAWLPPL